MQTRRSQALGLRLHELAWIGASLTLKLAWMAAFAAMTGRGNVLILPLSVLTGEHRPSHKRPLDGRLEGRHNEKGGERSARPFPLPVLTGRGSG